MKSAIFLSVASVACIGAGPLAISGKPAAEEDCDIRDNTLACALAWIAYEACQEEGTQVCVEPCCTISMVADSIHTMDRIDLERIFAAANGVTLADWLSAR